MSLEQPTPVYLENMNGDTLEMARLQITESTEVSPFTGGVIFNYFVIELKYSKQHPYVKQAIKFCQKLIKNEILFLKVNDESFRLSYLGFLPDSNKICFDRLCA